MPVNIFLPQVTRIPITGPEPYNTLVCVSVETYLGPQVVREGQLSRFPMRVATSFRLAGFDQRVTPTFDHSTTAWISSIGPMENGNWIYAVDSVTGAGFTPTDGSYYLDLMAAVSPDGNAPGTCIAFGEGVGICFYLVRIQATSWVLCYEPPIVPPPQGHIHQLNDLLRQGVSPADLARISTGSPGRTAAGGRGTAFVPDLPPGDCPLNFFIDSSSSIAKSFSRIGLSRSTLSTVNRCKRCTRRACEPE